MISLDEPIYKIAISRSRLIPLKALFSRVPKGTRGSGEYTHKLTLGHQLTPIIKITKKQTNVSGKKKTTFANKNIRKALPKSSFG